MCEFLGRYESTWKLLATSLVKISENFNDHLVNLTPQSLVDAFVIERGTGKQEPLPAAFEDVEVAAAFNDSSSHQPGDTNLCLGPSPSTVSSSAHAPGVDAKQISSMRAASAQASESSKRFRNSFPSMGLMCRCFMFFTLQPLLVLSSIAYSFAIARIYHRRHFEFVHLVSCLVREI